MYYLEMEDLIHTKKLHMKCLYIIALSCSSILIHFCITICTTLVIMQWCYQETKMYLYLTH